MGALCLNLLENFDCFIAGSKVKIISNHEPLRHILNGKHKLKGRLMRWCLQLSCYNLQIVYKPGDTNLAADFLSRLEKKSTLHFLEFSYLLILQSFSNF